jgi:hypothetical protein
VLKSELCSESTTYQTHPESNRNSYKPFDLYTHRNTIFSPLNIAIRITFSIFVPGNAIYTLSILKWKQIGLRIRPRLLQHFTHNSVVDFTSWTLSSCRKSRNQVGVTCIWYCVYLDRDTVRTAHHECRKCCYWVCGNIVLSFTYINYEYLILTIFKAYRCYQLNTKCYPTLFSRS